MFMFGHLLFFFFFFFNDTATTEIYTLSLHDALPISLHLKVRLLEQLLVQPLRLLATGPVAEGFLVIGPRRLRRDRKSTRLNSSHLVISYAVFCLKKKKKIDGILLHIAAHDAHTQMIQ